MIRCILAPLAAMVLFGGCTRAMVTDMTLEAAKTVTDLYYGQVMYNLAVVHEDRFLVPSQVKFERGLVQASDQVSPTLKLTWPAGIQATRDATLGAQRQVIENWSIIPLTHKDELRRVAGWYQWADLRRRQAVAQAASANLDPVDKQIEMALNSLKLPKANQPEDSLVPAADWYSVGPTPPSGARYVGKYRNTYAWVTSEHVADLAKFTLCVLDEVTQPPLLGGSSGAALNSQ